MHVVTTFIVLIFVSIIIASIGVGLLLYPITYIGGALLTLGAASLVASCVCAIVAVCEGY